MTRKEHRHLEASVRAALAAELRALRAAHGGLPADLVQRLARGYDISVRTVWRLAGDPGGAPRRRPQFTVTPQHRALVAREPNRRAAWRAAVAADTCSVSYEQFTRALRRQLDPAVLAGLLHGLPAMVAKQAYTLRESTHRNQLWVIDNYEVRVLVDWPGLRYPVKPVQTTVLDDCHRTVMGAVWWPKPPTTTEAVAALVAAVRGFTTPDGTFAGGVPDVLLTDQGGEFISEEATAAYLALRITPFPATAHAPWVKGKLEAFHHNVLDAGYAAFPGWTGGGVDSVGRQLLSTGKPLGRQEFRRRARALLDAYNTGHAHAALDGAPLNSWLADPAAVRRHPDDLLRPYWLSEQRKVTGKGVQLHTRHYQHGRLGHEVGRVLEVRYVPEDLAFVDVRLSTGEWVRAEQQPVSLRAADEVLRIRADQARQVRGAYRRAPQQSTDAHHADAHDADSADAADVAADLAEPAPPPVVRRAPASRRRAARVPRGLGRGQAARLNPAPPEQPPAPPSHLRPRRTSRPDPEEMR